MTKRQRLFLLSALDEASGAEQSRRLRRWLEQRGEQLDEDLLDSLTYTLNERRTQFPHKVLVHAQSSKELLDRLQEDKLHFTMSQKTKPVIGFVFTG